MYGDNPPVTFGDSPLYTRGPETDFLLRCPKFRSGIKATEILTAATRSPCFICHWRRTALLPHASVSTGSQ